MRRATLCLLVIGALVSVSPAQQLSAPTAGEQRCADYWKSIGTTAREHFLAASKLKPGRPVNDLQASLLASVYFDITFGMCGSTGVPKEKGPYWVFSTAIGYGATPGPEIWVAKASGITTCKGQRTVRDPIIYAKWAKR